MIKIEGLTRRGPSSSILAVADTAHARAFYITCPVAQASDIDDVFAASGRIFPVPGGPEP
ncbi:hypothetical protein [Rhizobium sp. BK379]|uniref:hypothetical protein n=1 Tax=Rhizobium sp. BK379 TaxID=2587059 RepID=UPI0016093D76|nr:hypothetical protein [Rhizobium sp. BK379]MBB3446752.1 hypothetical protein [Rhizobium sp. BK379]